MPRGLTDTQQPQAQESALRERQNGSTHTAVMARLLPQDGQTPVPGPPTSLGAGCSESHC